MTTTAYLVLKTVIDADTATFINALVTVIFGGAAIRTSQLRPKLKMK